MMSKIMKKFDSNEDNLKEIRGDISSMNQKVESHATSIKLIEQQIGQISAYLNPRQKGTLPSNTV